MHLIQQALDYTFCFEEKETRYVYVDPYFVSEGIDQPVTQQLTSQLSFVRVLSF